MSRIAVHLVSAPWAPPQAPSIQTGALKAYLDSVYPRDRVITAAYPAFYSILNQAADGDVQRFFDQYSGFGEVLFQLLYARRFALPGVSVEETTELLGRVATSEYTQRRPVPITILDKLEKASETFVSRALGPHLVTSGMNVVGFTMNYDQVYSSLYLLRLLREEVSSNELVVLFGGASAALPNTRSVLRTLDVDAWCVMGEGERKLQNIVATLLEVRNESFRDAMAALEGVTYASIPAPERPNPALQMGALDDLPCPDYTDYFSVRPHSPGRTVVLEGSRGCFGRCDFCGLNSQWLGFRHKRASTVIRQAMDFRERYRATDVQFVDNVCDTWAQEYASELSRREVKLSAFMELRASHPETFWTRLALAGVDRVQIGTEALSPPLLSAIGKGTRAFQNIAAQKYLKELGIEVSAMIMGYHPRSTIADIAETRRIVEAAPHLGPFGLTRYRISAGSPLYDQLTQPEKNALRTFITHPVSAQFDALQVGCWFQPPEGFGPPAEVCAAWEHFRSWYLDFLLRPENTAASLTVDKCGPRQLTIRDSRRGHTCESVIEGDLATVYDVCHGPHTICELQALTELPPATLERALEYLVGEQWLLVSEGRYIAIALRPRDTLLRNLLSGNDAIVNARTGERLELEHV